jgi:hypothetical protein
MIISALFYGLSSTGQQYFFTQISTSNLAPTSQQYFSFTTNQHQPIEQDE